MSTAITLAVILDDDEVAALTADQKLAYWRDLSYFSKKMVAAEQATRKVVVADYFPGVTEDGTHNYELPGGLKLKTVLGTNYNLAENDKVDETLTIIERIGAEGAFLAERLVGWTPKLSVGEFKKLDENIPAQKQIKELLQAILTTKTATPTLEIVEPKTK